MATRAQQLLQQKNQLVAEHERKLSKVETRIHDLEFELGRLQRVREAIKEKWVEDITSLKREYEKEPTAYDFNTSTKVEHQKRYEIFTITLKRMIGEKKYRLYINSTRGRNTHESFPSLEDAKKKFNDYVNFLPTCDRYWPEKHDPKEHGPFQDYDYKDLHYWHM